VTCSRTYLLIIDTGGKKKAEDVYRTTRGKRKEEPQKAGMREKSLI
jgi:hypothetical protein